MRREVSVSFSEGCCVVEPAGDLARGKGLFRQVDGEREEILPRLRLLHCDRGAQHRRLAVGCKDSAVGLACNSSGLECEAAAAPHQILSVYVEHLSLLCYEFFDALSVEIISPKGQLRISEKDGQLFESWHPASPEALEFLDRYSVHPEPGERVEASPIAQRHMSQIPAAIERGVIIAIDYGYTRQEQLAGRHRGTIAAYRQHSVSTNPYEAPGEQDITAHVNFTALAAAAEAQGMQVQPLVTQSQFLMGIGEHNQFADVFKDCRLPQERAKVALQLKHLVTPAGMGETFHVLIASKGIEPQKVAALSGLTFGKTPQEPHRSKSSNG